MDVSDDSLDPNIHANEHTIHPTDVDKVLSKNEVTELAASTIAKLKMASSVVQSTVDHVVHESSDLFPGIVTSLEVKTEQFLDNKGIDENDPERQNLLEWFAQFEYPLEELETAYKKVLH